MSDTSKLAKSIFALSIIVLLVTLLSAQPPPGASLPGTNTPLTNLQDQLEEGFPSFYNPFSQTYLATTMTPWNSSGSRVTVGCTNTTYWECIATEDGNASYIRTMSPVVIPFTVNMTNATVGGLEIVNLVITVYCATTGTNVYRVVLTNDAGGGTTFTQANNEQWNVVCPTVAADPQDHMEPVIVNLPPICYSLPANSRCIFDNTNFTNPSLSLDLWPVSATQDGETDWGYVKVDMYTSSQPPCGGSLFDSVGCNIGRFFTMIGNFFLLIGSGILFVAQLVLWFIMLIVSFVTGFVGALLWIVTIPGTPPIISGITLALVVTLLLIVVLTFAKYIRGTEG